MIQLTDEHRISTGANRACFVHPQHPDRCIKVDLEAGQGTRGGTNATERAHHQRVATRIGEGFYRHAPRFFGTEATDRGPGLVFEMIRDADGERSARIIDYVRDRPDRLENTLAMIDELFAFVMEHDAGLMDVNLHNLLVRVDEQGDTRLVSIDWKGPAANREFLPLSSWFKFFLRRKITRRFDRLRGYVRDAAAPTP